MVAPSGGTVTDGGGTKGHRLGGGARHGTVMGGCGRVTALVVKASSVAA